MGAGIDPRIKESYELLDAAARLDALPIYDPHAPGHAWRRAAAADLRGRAARLRRGHDHGR